MFHPAGLSEPTHPVDNGVGYKAAPSPGQLLQTSAARQKTHAAAGSEAQSTLGDPVKH